MGAPEKVSFDRSARLLRIINVLAFIPGLVLLLVSGLTTRTGSFNLIAVAPLTLSALLGLLCVTSKGKPVSWSVYADLFLASFFVSVLVPLWVSLGAFSDGLGVSEVVLCAYGTMPLIVDFCIHCYLVLRTFPNRANVVIRACSHCHQPRTCPNCKYAIPPPDDLLRWKSYQTHDDPLRSRSNDQLELGTNDRFKRLYGDDDNCNRNRELCHPALEDYQAELFARDSSEFQTSGCNTPRGSAETLHSSRISGDVGFDEGCFDSLV